MSFSHYRRAALEKWKQKLGSNATYNKLICAFEQAGYQEYADAIRKLVLQISVNKTDNSTDEKLFPTLPECVSQPQLPIFPEPAELAQTITLSSATAVFIEEEYQKGQYIVFGTGRATLK